eukprot:12291966-Alexandrium_andersonii.AAC.1
MPPKAGGQSPGDDKKQRRGRAATPRSSEPGEDSRRQSPGSRSRSSPPGAPVAKSPAQAASPAV